MEELRIGIVGHAAEKFTSETEGRAREVIRGLVRRASLIVSGGCHMGGIDIWAVEEANKAGVPTLVFLPKQRSWDGGYRERNLQIAEASDEVWSIVVEKLPPGFDGMRFPFCYHCKTPDHVKSGGCWTVKEARKLGKHGIIAVIKCKS